jgi:glyoxylase-like metal-dependent hydrolase (beta-lactamase superfamily II)
MRLTIAALTLLAATTGAFAQQPQQPTFATTKVEGTDNVYIFRYQAHQAMFIVTPAGVIATDPISLKRPAAKAYVEEIQKITKAPIRYLIYSHYHYDHIAGGKPFKDAGATVIAHRNSTRRLAALKDPDVVIPTQNVDRKRVITLGGTTLELHYVGRNHSDGSLVMLLPKEKIIFTVDFIPIASVPSRLGVGDSYPGEWEASLKRVLAMNWDRMIPGHPGPGGRLGTKKDLEQMIAYFTDLSAAVKKAACGEGVAAAPIRHPAELRAEHRHQHPSLLLALGTRILSSYAELRRIRRPPLPGAGAVL